jgi:hypothetical protein
MKVSELLYIHEQQGLETAISEVLKICDSSKHSTNYSTIRDKIKKTVSAHQNFKKSSLVLIQTISLFLTVNISFQISL